MVGQLPEESLEGDDLPPFQFMDQRDPVQQFAIEIPCHRPECHPVDQKLLVAQHAEGFLV